MDKTVVGFDNFQVIYMGRNDLVLYKWMALIINGFDLFLYGSVFIYMMPSISVKLFTSVSSCFLYNLFFFTTVSSRRLLACFVHQEFNGIQMNGSADMHTFMLSLLVCIQMSGFYTSMFLFWYAWFYIGLCIQMFLSILCGSSHVNLTLLVLFYSSTAPLSCWTRKWGYTFNYTFNKKLRPYIQ